MKRAFLRRRASAHPRERRDRIQGAGALRSRHDRRLEAIVLASEPRAVTPSNETAHLLAEGIAKLGLSRLPWGRAQNQLRDRIGFLRAAGGDEWPDRTDAGLTNTVAQWLAPFLARDGIAAPWPLQKDAESKSGTFA